MTAPRATVVEYRAAPGSHISDAQAQVAGPILAELAEATGGVSAAAIVDRARPKSSPIHEHFTWEDKTAAEERRLDQARYLVRSVRAVVRMAGRRDPIMVSAFPRMVDADGASAFVPVVRVMTHADQRQWLLRQALREFHALEEKYGVLEEFAAVFEAGREVARRLSLQDGDAE